MAERIDQNTPKEFTVTKPFFYGGDEVAVGDKVNLTPDQYELVKKHVTSGA